MGKKNPGNLSVITGGSTQHSNGNISPFPDGQMKSSYSYDDVSLPDTPSTTSSLSPNEKRLFPETPKKKSKFQRLI
ncbi:hypothetical protein ACF0H5_015559 [Mactra antiquata]